MTQRLFFQFMSQLKLNANHCQLVKVAAFNIDSDAKTASQTVINNWIAVFTTPIILVKSSETSTD